MKVRKSLLRKVIQEELGTLNEECPTGLPCPIAAAAELKDAGASPEEMLDWIAKLTQELLSPVDRGDGLDPTGAPAQIDGAPEPPGLESLLSAGEEY